MAKRISQLTALTSASLDTTLLGVDRGVSYKIELDVLADAVQSRINTLDDIRLDSLEAFTASYIAASVPNGTISGSSQLTSSFDQRYTLSGSIETDSFARTGSNTFTDNQTILGFVTASSYLGNGRYLDNLPATTNWNYNQEFTIKKTEQLTFSGDYILENTYLEIEGGDVDVQYSSNKYFKKEGTIFIGGNLLVKDSYIKNDGKISVGGEVILIGNSQITGTGTII